ncbi:hypothetical protein NDU88_004832 [Pleurodeles waltl]|uniref:Uncharacterized protein n=1 Tax=Pleurodeles waltl TaxID=8319 RepID=A0AAV7NKY7_PLEWA|nr:hypothetical protein NDU88_004832 [Pleurodeles waltl]
MSNDLTWSDGFQVKEEGLGHGGRGKPADGQRERQGEKELEDARTWTEDPRKVKDEEEREDIGGKQLGSKEDPKVDTEVEKNNEGEKKEEGSRGPRGGNLVLGEGADGEPARKEDTAKGPCHVPGGEWLHKVAMTTLDAITNKCPGGTLMSNDPTWSDGFRVKEEGLGHGGREKQADGQRERQGVKELEDAITRTEDPRKAKDEEE